jgi:hypothetical protein
VNDLARRDDPDAVAVWVGVAPVGKGLRDQLLHAFGAGWLAAALTLAKQGEDPAHIEVPTMCNTVVTLAEMRGDAGGAPCEPCLAVAPLAPETKPEDPSDPLVPARRPHDDKRPPHREGAPYRLR